MTVFSCGVSVYTVQHHHLESVIDEPVMQFFESTPLADADLTNTEMPGLSMLVNQQWNSCLQRTYAQS